MKLYTRLGDDGTTSLYGGKRVMKDDIRIEVSGEIDELNAHIGLLAAESDAEVSRFLAEIQARLFIIGSCLSSTAGNRTWRVGKDVRGEGSLGCDEIARLEHETDRLQSIVSCSRHLRSARRKRCCSSSSCVPYGMPPCGAPFGNA